MIVLTGNRAFFVPAGFTFDKGNDMTDAIPIDKDQKVVELFGRIHLNV